MEKTIIEKETDLRRDDDRVTPSMLTMRKKKAEPPKKPPKPPAWSTQTAIKIEALKADESLAEAKMGTKRGKEKAAIIKSGVKTISVCVTFLSYL